MVPAFRRYRPKRGRDFEPRIWSQNRFPFSPASYYLLGCAERRTQFRYLNLETNPRPLSNRIIRTSRTRFRVQNLESKSRPRFSWFRPTFQASARNNRCADPRLEGWRGCPRRRMILRGGRGRGEERGEGCGHTQNFHRPDCVDIKIAFVRP